MDADDGEVRHGWGKESFLSIFYGVHFGGWRRQNSAKLPPGIGVFLG
jgi:hypothetical protein